MRTPDFAWLKQQLMSVKLGLPLPGLAVAALGMGVFSACTQQKIVANEETLTTYKGNANNDGANKPADSAKTDANADTTAPTVTLSSQVVSPTNATTALVAVELSEAVTSFDLSKLVLSVGASAAQLTGSGTSYAFVLTLAPNVSNSVSAGAGAVSDAAGNASTVSNSLTFIQDAVGPTAPVVAGLTPTNNTKPTWTWAAGGGGNGSFRYAVDAADLDQNSTTTTSLSYAPTTALTAGNHTLYVQEQDAAGNWSASGSKALLIDTTAPTVSISSATVSPSNLTSIAVQVEFSEAVTGFALNDITVSAGATASALTGSGTNYSFTLTLATNATTTVNIAAAAAADAAGNGNTLASTFSFTQDANLPNAPVVTANTPTNNTTPTWSYTSGGQGNGTFRYKLDSSDFTSGTTQTTSLNFTPGSALAQGTHTFYVQERNNAGTWSATGSFAIVIDTTAPTVAISSTATSPTNASSIPVTVTFSEPVTGFVVGDVTAFGGTVSAFAGSGASYTFTFTFAGADGAKTLNIASSAAADAALNSSVAATQYSITWDTTAPTAPVVTGPANTNNTMPTYTWTSGGGGSGNYRFKMNNATLTSGATLTSTASFSPGSALTAGTNTLYVQEQDAAGNWSAAGSFAVNVDTAAPTVIISSTAGASTNVSPVPITVTFSESVTGFAVGNLTLVGGTASGFSGSGTTYTFNFTPSGNGTKTVDIAAGVATDTAGNTNTAATQLSRTYDNVAPTVTITSTAPASTNTPPIPVTVTFSEAVTGFAVGNLTLVGGTASGFSGSGTTYTFNFDPAGNGTKTVDIAGGVATDAAGNANTAATQLSRIYNNTSPSVSITSSAAASTNVSPIPVTVTFSDTVTGFVVGDIALVGGTASGFAGSGTTYTFDFTPVGNGVKTVDVAAGVATDSSSNTNTAAPQLSRIYDSVAPTVTISSSASASTNTSPIPVTVTFSESVTGFVVGGLTLSGGAASSFAGSGTTYTFNFTPSGNGTKTVDVAAGVATDAAGNTNTAATQLSRIYDTVVPTVSITSSAGASTNVSPIPVTVTFSKSVTGFAVGNLTLSGGTASGFTGSGTTYNFNFTPSGNGTKTVDIAGGVATDAAGNTNTAATQLSRIYDTAAPSVAITSSANASTNTSPIPVTVTFSESVTGFALGNLTLSGGTASGFSGSGATYTFNFTPSGNGTKTVDVAAGVATDAAGNTNTAATQLSRIYDTVLPTVAITSAASASTNTSPIPVTVTFSKSVTGFAVGNLTLSGGTASGFTGSGTTYTFNFTPSGNGTKTVDIAAGVATDPAGNTNTAATQLSRIYDTATLTVAITSSAAASTNVSPIPMTVTFNKSVTGFAVGNLTLAGGTASSFSGSGTTYTFNFTPSGNGTKTVDIAAGVATDAAGNTNTAAAQLSRIYDSVAPTVAITSSASASTNVSPIPVTVTFSKSVTGFAVGNLTLAGGTASGFTGSGTTYTFNFTPSGNGTKTVDIAAGIATDAAGNTNTVATQLSRVYDGTAPTVAVSSTATASTNVSPIPVTITFSESVTGFAVGNLTLAGGTASGFTGSGTTYTFDFTPSGDGTKTVDISAGVASDAAGNMNSVATQFSRIYDTTGPTVILSSSSSLVTNASPIPITATFSEPVVGVLLNNFILSGGTASNFSGSGTTYTFDFAPIGDGNKTIDFGAGNAFDAAANISAAATQLGRTYDTVAPNAPTVSGPASTTSTTPTWTWVTGGGGGNANWRYKLNSTDFSSGSTTTSTASFTPGSALSAGNNSLYVQERDTAGNWSLSGSFTINVDNVAPTIVSLNSSTPNGGYGLGSVVSIQVNFSEIVNVTGTPRLTLETGSFDAVVNYTSGSGTSSLTFDYTVSSAHATNVLDAQSTSALALNAGTIKDSATNNAVLTLPILGTSGSLASNKSILIDAFPPTTPIASGPTASSSLRPTWSIASGGGGNGTFRVKVDNSTMTSGTTDPLGNTYTPPSDLTVGSHTFYVQERDAVGNWSSTASFVTSVVGPGVRTATAIEPLGRSSQRKTCYDGVNSLHWIFYKDGSQIQSAYSFDNVTFTSSSALAYNTNNFSASCKAIAGTTYAFIAAEKGAGDIALVRGTLSSGGVSFGSEVVVFDGSGSNSSDEYSRPSVATDGSNKIWVAAVHSNSASSISAYLPRVRQTTNAGDGDISVLETQTSLGSRTSKINDVVVLPRTGDEMLVIANGANMLAWKYASSAWSSANEGGVATWLSTPTEGPNGNVQAVTVSGTDLYIGGTFTNVSNIYGTAYIAKWNGSEWSALGTGTNGSVNTIAVSGGDVYAGGTFTQAGGVSGTLRVAKWNGVSWNALTSGVDASVNVVAVLGSDVYVGGTFSTAGGLAAQGIAKWNGTTWSALGTGTNGNVSALAFSGSDVYAGGQFISAGGVANTGRIAKWDGTTWSPLGTGMNGFVNALAVSGGDVYAGGAFTLAGGVSGTARIAKWNGTAWSPLGSGMNLTVNALAVSGSDVFAAGDFTSASSISNTNYIAKWDGSSWSSMSTGTDASVAALAVSGSNIYAGGSFISAGGISGTTYIATWNGSSWSGGGFNRINKALNGSVFALALSGSDVYVGGSFTSAGGVANTSNIAKWDGTAWSALGTGVNGTVNAIAVAGSDIYVGGQFTLAGGVANTSRIAKWNGTAWSPLGTGANSYVYALVVSGTDVYAGGYFTSAGGVANTSNIAKWNGSAWSALGTGMNGVVNALAVSGSDIYAGGDFSLAGGVANTVRIAKWNGTVWSPMSTGASTAVYAIQVSGSDVYAGGDFSTIGGVSAARVAKWNGTAWSAVGTGASSVRALAMMGGEIYIGGSFTSIMGVANTAYIAKLISSAWGSAGGANNNVTAFAVSGTTLYAGGGFTNIGGSNATNFSSYDSSAVSQVRGANFRNLSAISDSSSGDVGLTYVNSSGVYFQTYASSTWTTPVTLVTSISALSIALSVFAGGNLRAFYSDSGAVSTRNRVSGTWNSATNISTAGTTSGVAADQFIQGGVVKLLRDDGNGLPRGLYLNTYTN